MGSFRQHIFWAQWCVMAFLAGSLAVLQGEYFFTWMMVPGFFVWGTVMPDADLPHDKMWRKVLFGIIFPPSLFIKMEHWGHLHSGVAGIALGVIVCALLMLIRVPPDSAFYLSMAFMAGFDVHLIVDQVYHEARGKRWKKKALKIW